VGNRCIVINIQCQSEYVPKAWNSLPDYLQDLTRSFDSFRSDLKTFLVILAYTVHYRLCDYAPYKSTIDIDIVSP